MLIIIFTIHTQEQMWVHNLIEVVAALLFPGLKQKIKTVVNFILLQKDNILEQSL